MMLTLIIKVLKQLNLITRKVPKPLTLLAKGRKCQAKL